MSDHEKRSEKLVKKFSMIDAFSGLARSNALVRKAHQYGLHALCLHEYPRPEWFDPGEMVDLEFALVADLRDGLIAGAFTAEGFRTGELAPVQPSNAWWTDAIMDPIKNTASAHGAILTGTRFWKTEIAKGVIVDVPHLDKTGAPGKPTSMGNLILPEMRRRAKDGLIENGVTAESQALLRWLEANHPSAPRPTARTIENAIRIQFRKLRR